jgi:alpha-ribazole phosphatase
MKTYKIHFIRHGLTDANVDGRYIGVTDLALSTMGAEQLCEIRDTGLLPQCDIVFTSPLKRCVETCEILFPASEPIVIDEFKEYNFGDFENKTANELELLPQYIEWTSGRATATPNGEDSADFTRRICLGLNKIVRKMMELQVYEASVVVHGGVIMSLFAATALPRRRMIEWTCDAGCGYTARITPSLYGRSGIIEIVDTVPSSFNGEDELD